MYANYFALTEFYEVALRVELLLYHRLCWLSRGYRVCVPMHNLPLTVFRSKDHRRPQGVWVISSLPPILALARSIPTT